MAWTPSRPQRQVRAPSGELLTVEYDPFRDRWWLTPGGYESGSLPRTLAQATGSPEEVGWSGC